MAAFKEVLRYVLAGVSALVGISSFFLWSGGVQAIYGIFYLILAAIIFYVRSSNKYEMMAYAITALFGTIALSLFYQGDVIWGVVCVILAALIFYKRPKAEKKASAPQQS